MATWRDAPPEWGTEATPARQAAMRANLGHTAQNDHQPVGQDSPAGLFYCRKTPRAQPDFIISPSRTSGFIIAFLYISSGLGWIQLAHNRILSVLPSRTTGFKITSQWM